MANLRADNLTGTGGRNAIDGSLFFNGVDSYLVCTDNSDFALGTGDFTVEGWFLVDTNLDYRSFIDNRTSVDDDWMIGMRSNDRIYVYAGAFLLESPTGSVTPGHWHHVAYVRSSGTHALYLNGVSVATSSTSKDYDSQKLAISAPPYNVGAEEFKGYVSNVRIIKGTALYTANFTPPTSKLTAVDGTVLLCCQDSDDPTQEATGKTITGYGGLDINETEYVTNGTFGGSGTSPGGSTYSPAWTAWGDTTTAQSGGIFIERTSTLTGVYQQLPSTSMPAGQYKLRGQISNKTGPGGALIRLSSASQGNGTNFFGAYASPATSEVIEHTFTYSGSGNLYVNLMIGNNTGSADFSNISFRQVYTGDDSSNVLPPVGIDEGVTFKGDTKHNTESYMYFPTGDTAQRGRGRGVFGGGYYEPGAGSANLKSIEYFNIQSTGNAIDFGDRTIVGHGLATVSSSTRGVMMGGRAYHYPSAPSSPQTNIIDYVTIATTSNATNFGDLVDGDSYIFAAASNATRGIISKGGTTDMSYITIATLGDAVDTGGDSTVARNTFTGFASPTRAIFAGGGTPSAINNIDYVTIASLGDAINFGDLTFTGHCQGASSETRGIIFTGGFPSAASNVIDFITIASTGDAQDFGDLHANITSHSAGSGISNSIRAVRCGGYVAPAKTNRMDYVTITTTGNSSDFGDLIVARYSASGFSDSHGGLS